MATPDAGVRSSVPASETITGVDVYAVLEHEPPLQLIVEVGGVVSRPSITSPTVRTVVPDAARGSSHAASASRSEGVVLSWSGQPEHTLCIRKTTQPPPELSTFVTMSFICWSVWLAS